MSGRRYETVFERELRESRKCPTLFEGFEPAKYLDIRYMPHYCLMCKSKRTGKVTFYSLEKHKRVDKCERIFSEGECMEIYLAARKEMERFPYLRIFIYDSMLCPDGKEIWHPKKNTVSCRVPCKKP